MKKLLLAALLLPGLALAADSPFTGTWKADLGKIQLSDKPEMWVLQAGQYQCTTCVPKIDIKADGTDQLTTGTKYTDTTAVKVVNDTTVEFTDKKGGRIVSTASEAVSPDGQTLTVEFTSYPETSKQPVTGRQSMTRVAAGPVGSHAISGSWRAAKLDTVSDNGLTITFKSSTNGLIMTAATGESYDAKFDGKDYPIKGDAAGSVVSLKKVSERSIEETTKRDGKVVYVNYMTVSADGKTLTVKSEDKERGTTMAWVANKQS